MSSFSVVSRMNFNIDYFSHHQFRSLPANMAANSVFLAEPYTVKKKTRKLFHWTKLIHSHSTPCGLSCWWVYACEYLIILYKQNEWKKWKHGFMLLDVSSFHAYSIHSVVGVSFVPWSCHKWIAILQKYIAECIKKFIKHGNLCHSWLLPIWLTFILKLDLDSNCACMLTK